MARSTLRHVVNHVIDKSIKDNEVRVDTHVHSYASRAPNNWLMDSVGASESYTQPDQLYELCKQRGMDLVTISDHDTIEAVIELRASHPDDTFISEEVSAAFPEDGCIVHTLVLDISEAQHVEIQRLRRNIYELVEYLDEHGIPFFACHLLSPVNLRLDRSHIQRCLLMYRGLELRNGARDAAHEQGLRNVVAGLSVERLARWANLYPQVPFLNQDGRYAWFGGSDDHAGLSIARAHTVFRGPATVAGLREAIRNYATDAGGLTATPDLLCHNVYGVVAGVLLHSGQLSLGLGEGSSSSLGQTITRYASYLDEADRQFDFEDAILKGHEDSTHEALHQIIDRILVRANRDALKTLAEAVAGGQLAAATDALPDLAKALALSIPYLSSVAIFRRDTGNARGFCRQLDASLPEPSLPRVAILCDTLDDVHGVSLGLRRLIAQAKLEGRDLRLVGLGDGEQTVADDEGVVRIPCVLWHRLKDYESIAFGVPSLTSLMHYLVTERIDLVQCSTPGPMGLVGLAVARMAGIPVIGQYYTDLPEYVERLTRDRFMATMASSFVGWFYGKLDQVLAPSRAVVERLLALGVAEDKIRLIPRGIDHSLFRPDKREPEAFAEFGLNGEPKVLYVGRLSREKGLDALVTGFRQTAEKLPGARLLLVGDGPHAHHLRRQAGGDPRIIFTGEQTGGKLAKLYASADVFVCPSETETLGNTVVEAQAAGIPVVVANRGAACENVIPGETGILVDADRPEELAAALQHLLEQPELRQRMGRAAHAFARRYTMESALEGTFAAYTSLLDQLRFKGGVGSPG